MKSITLTYKGLCLGQPLKLRHFHREDTSQVPKPDQLFWGDSMMVLDLGKLNAKQSNALPRAFCIIEEAKLWEPFIREMILAGKL